MRRLFIVLAKIIGLLQIYWGLTYLSSISLFISQLAVITSTEPAQPMQYVIQSGGIVFFSLLCFGMAWLLLARTEWLADKLNVQEEGESRELKDDVILRVGIKLIGVYVTVYAIPALAKALSELATFGLGYVKSIGLWTKILPATLQLVLGLFVMFRSDKVVDLVAGNKKLTEEQVDGWSESVDSDQPST